MNNNYRPTSRDLEMRARTGSTAYTYRPTTSGSKPNDAGKLTGLVAASWIALLIAFTIHPFLGAIALFGIVYFAIIFSKRKKAGQQTGSPVSMTAASRQSDDHLCDPGQHSDEDRSSREALDDMQQGYTTYSGTTAGAAHTAAASTAGHMMFRRSRLTREQMNKKTEELKSLREAGIIGDAEYRKMLQEYSAFVG